MRDHQAAPPKINCMPISACSKIRQILNGAEDGKRLRSAPAVQKTIPVTTAAPTRCGPIPEPPCRYAAPRTNWKNVAHAVQTASDRKCGDPVSGIALISSCHHRLVKSERLISEQKNICAKEACAVETAQGRRTMTVMPPSTACAITVHNAKYPNVRTHARDSVRHSHTASTTVSVATIPAITRCVNS